MRGFLRVVAASLLLAVLAGGPAPAAAEAGVVGTITYVKGEAKRTPTGAEKWAALSEAGRIFQGDRVKTGGDGRLEAKLMDGSMLRLASSSELSLDHMSFSKGKAASTKKVSVKLWAGRVWAAVSKLLGKDSSFEVSTENAVAGVRGTRFEASRDAAGGTSVKVYSGQVLVSNRPIYAMQGATKSKRVEVKGPEEISKKQWEELVAGAMQVVRVTAMGEMSQPDKFALADPATDDWESWNSERDKTAGLGE